MLNQSDLSATLEVDATAEQRWLIHDQIDAVVREFCLRHDKDQLAEKLQTLGVPAAPVRTTTDQALDPNVRARGSLQMLQHKQPVLGYRAHPHAPLPWRLVGRSRRALSDYRHTGEDNERVLSRWLDMSTAEIAALQRTDVLYLEPPLDLPPRRKPKNHDPLHGAKLGLPT